MRSVKVLWGIVGLLLAAVLVMTVLLVRSGGQTPAPAQPLPSGTDPSGNEKPDKKIAVIGSRTITEEELKERLLEKHGAELLSILLDREAIRQEAERTGISVSREDIEKELLRMREGYESEEQFFRSMKDQLGLTKAELNEDVYYKLLLERIALRTVQVSDAEVDAYMKEHPEEFGSFTQYHLLKIEVKTKEEAAQIVKDLKEGADFASIARKQSIDERSAKDGGDLGWIEEHDPFFPPFLLDAARDLGVNGVSKPIPLKSSFAVIQLKEKRVIEKTVDEDTRAYIRKELGLQKAVPLKKLVQSLRDKYKAHILDPTFH